jgi:hypothetical protein
MARIVLVLLKYVLLVALVPVCVICVLVLREVWIALRFLWSSRSLARAPVAADPALDPSPGKKLTPEEEKAQRRARLRRVYGPGLSAEKLDALWAVCSGNVEWLLSGWAKRLIWEGWCRLALAPEHPGQAQAVSRVRAGYAQFRPPRLRDLALFLRVCPPAEHDDHRHDWASGALAGRGTRRAAERMLETLAAGADPTQAARALETLLVHRLERGQRDLATALLKRRMALPGGDDAFQRHRDAVMARYRPTFEGLTQPLGGWTFIQARRASGATWGVSRVEAEQVPAADWLTTPSQVLHGAALGAEVAAGPLRMWRLPLSTLSIGAARIAEPKGHSQLRIEVAPEPAQGWAAAFPGVPLPAGAHLARSTAPTFAAALTLTEQQALVWAVALPSGAPLVGATVQFVLRDATGKTQTEQIRETDATGLVALPTEAYWQLGVRLLRRHPDGHGEVLVLTHGQDISTRGAAASEERLYVWLARPLYRPGETVQGKLLVRTKGSAGPSQRGQGGRTYRLQVLGPRGTLVAEVALQLSRFGSAPLTFALPADAALGRYRFVAPDQAGQVEGSLQVEEFVAPEHRVALAPKGQVRWGQAIELRLDADYYFGGPVAGAVGTVEVQRVDFAHQAGASWPPGRRSRTPKRLRALPVQTDAKGKATLKLPWRGPWDLLRRVDGSELQLTARLQDASGKSCEASLTLSVERRPVAVGATAQARYLTPGEPLPLALAWRGEAPTPAAPAQLSLVFTREDGRGRQRLDVTVDGTQAEASVVPALPPGRWTLQSRQRGQRRPLLAPQELWVLGPGLKPPPHGALRCSADRARAGQPVRLVMAGAHGADRLLLQWSRGPALSGALVPWQGDVAWTDLTLPEGRQDVHFRAWYLGTDGRLASRLLTVPVQAEAVAGPTLGLALAFPSPVVAPGQATSLSVQLDDPKAEAELVCTVVDEALFALVPAPRDPLAFFEADPPASKSPPAFSTSSDQPQQGRGIHGARPFSPGRPGRYSDTELYASLDMDESEGIAMPRSMAMPSPGMVPMQVQAAPRSRSGFSMPSMPSMPSRSSSATPAREKSDGNAPEASQVVEAPATLRSDFSAEAAWFAEVPLEGPAAASLAVRLPDTLTTWRASALAVALDQRLGAAVARVTTQKPLMVRLQLPRFFQEGDALTLLALVDSRLPGAAAVRGALTAEGLRLSPAGEQTWTLEPGGQARLASQATVLASAARELTVEARAAADGPDAASDADQRRVLYRPYGVERSVALRGVLTGEREALSLALPEARQKEHTLLSLRLDRGPLDAVLQALDYLREYPYGCVEQTCSRLIPQLVWQRVQRARRRGGAPVDALSPAMVKESLQRLASMQNPDGGYGWWRQGRSDVWMTAYVVFSLSLVDGLAAADAQQRACAFLSARLLDAENRDDEDAFALFALAWLGQTPPPRAVEVLVGRWDRLRLTEQAKLAWAMAARKHPDAARRLQMVSDAVVPEARKFLKAVARDDQKHARWYQPAATEALAFLLLADLKLAPSRGPEGLSAADRQTVVAFLLQHRQVGRWHSTRDTALAVLALLLHEERTTDGADAGKLSLEINGTERFQTLLGGLEQAPIAVDLRDDALASGDNRLELVARGLDPASLGQPRHYTVSLRYFTTEQEIPPDAQGLQVSRTYQLLDDRQRVVRALREGETVRVGQRLRVTLKVRAERPLGYVLLEDPKLAGCEPLARKSGPAVCTGECAHVELRADRTAIFLGALGKDEQTLSYDLEAQLEGTFHAMPATAEPMYDGDARGSSGSFTLTVAPRA